jgi:hypothetical protein
MEDSTFKGSASSMSGFIPYQSGLHTRGRRESCRLKRMTKVGSPIPTCRWTTASPSPPPNHSPNFSGRQGL